MPTGIESASPVAVTAAGAADVAVTEAGALAAGDVAAFELFCAYTDLAPAAIAIAQANVNDPITEVADRKIRAMRFEAILPSQCAAKP
ncbi:MAG TPA: hypothetical protein VND20_02745 [Candidatus Binataceae bacterium]|nr:hypothetical protein [Candidatus Binataceae bacterium]